MCVSGVYAGLGLGFGLLRVGDDDADADAATAWQMPACTERNAGIRALHCVEGGLGVGGRQPEVW